MEYSLSVINKLKETQLSILKYINEICIKNDIEYILMAGTLLGAKRHGGFIPWDDDIDIAMTRMNYNKFIEVCKKELSSEYFLQVFPYDPKSPYAFAKLRLNDTLFVEYCSKKIDMHQGIFIDIFPIDNAPNNYHEQIRYKRKYWFVWKLYCLREIPETLEKPEGILLNIKSGFRSIIHYSLKCIPKKIFFNWVISTQTKYNSINTDFVHIPSEIINKKCLFPVSKIQFEGEWFYAPRDTDAYLKNKFGDYMQLPPIEKQIGHKPYKLKV